VDTPDAVAVHSRPVDPPGKGYLPGLDLLPLGLLAVGSALVVLLLDLTGLEAGVAAPLWDAPETWILVFVFPVIVAALDAVIVRVRRRLSWRQAIRHIRGWRIAELAFVVAALRLLLLTSVARKEAIPHLRGGFVWDERLAEIDRWLHFGTTPDQYLRWLIDSPGLLKALDLFYLEGFWLGCTAVLLWWGWSRHPERGRFFTAFALVWLVLGGLFATIFASAGPCYYELVTGGSRYSALMEALHRQPLSATAIQDLLWRNYRGESTGVVEGISAFPSVHVAMPALFAWSATARLRWAAWTFCGLTLVGSVALGWHYAVDGYFAIPGAWLCWWGAAKLTRRSPPPVTAGTKVDLPATTLRREPGPGQLHPDSPWAHLFIGRWFALVSAALILLGVVPQLLARPIPDVSWLLYMAEQILAGATPYVDVVEVNPPLIVWLNLPIAALGNALGVPPVLVYRLVVFGCAGLSLLLCARTLRRLLGTEWKVFGRVILLVLVFVELPLARADFGEREHLLVLVVVPYVLAVFGRVRGVALPAMEMVLVGLLAGIGVALKPYFVALPLALECFLALRQRSARVWLRPEPLAMLTLGAGYLAAVVMLVPQYLDLTSMMGRLYAGYLRGPLWLTGILGEGAALCLFALLAFAVLRRGARHPALWAVLAVAVAALFASALVQGKGWRYHFYPSMCFGVLLLGVMWWDSRRPLLRLVEQVYAAACAAAVATLLIVTAVECLRQTANSSDPRYDADPNYAELRRLIRREAPGGSVLVLSSNMASSFPLVPTSGARWASRFPSVWLLPALYMDELRSEEPLTFRPRAAMGVAERYLNDAVGEDLARFRPDLLVVLRAGPDRREMGIRRVDYLAYFSREPEVAALLSEYAWLADVDEYRVYRRGAVGLNPGANPGPAATDAAVSAGWDGLRGVKLDRSMLGGALLLIPLLAFALVRERRAAA
jgi:hypothetical protein